MKYSKIECKERYAIIHNPQNKIDGKYRDIISSWAEDSNEWEETTEKTWGSSKTKIKKEKNSEKNI